uniref:fibronectin type III domain-containing protein n=1 Tax=Nocardioides pelophilus TaxID=2172019 RepID=UPI00160389CD|nr:fibronectin type III domain-containing protein [Nocardioides pelophilus]
MSPRSFRGAAPRAVAAVLLIVSVVGFGPTASPAVARAGRVVARAGRAPVAPTHIHASSRDAATVVSWRQPDFRGPRVQHYEVRFNGRVTRTADRRVRLTGLVNGTDYRISVRGINRRGAGPWSAAVVDHPNGEPVVARAPAIVADGPDADPSALISWTYDDNGHPVTRYEVRRTGGRTVACRAAPDTACRVALREGRDDTFQVRLFNRDNPRVRAIDGWGPWSPATSAARGATQPGPVRNLTVAPTGRSQQARVTFGGADLHGAQSVQYYYRVSGSAAHPITSPAVIGGLPNGSNVNVSVWAVTTANGQQSAPGPEASDTVNTFGPCTVNVSPGTAGYQSHTFHWSITSHGRPCSWSGDGPGGAPQGSGVSSNGQVTKAAPAGGATTLTVIAATATSGDDPSIASVSDNAAGPAWLKHTYAIKHEGMKSPCDFEDCRYVHIQVHDWKPNSIVRCSVAGAGAPDWYADIHTDGGGDSGWVNEGPAGRLYDSAGTRLADGTFDGDSGEFSCTQQ